ncbi:hypothetical protein QQF64_012849 [Cirrhinus molitorella]|uniref:SGNH hydrolase-type esterase domain-containing protein n=1 Tax=Cirrhinus molitorella TaxID=172907 RepID=A0ABR3LZT7_9TELE
MRQRWRPVSLSEPLHPSRDSRQTRDDTFELHSVQVELEAVEKQIRQLLERQAELRAALESSRDALFPDVLHSGAGTPRTLGAAAAEDASQATDDDLSPSAAPGLRDLHPEPLRSPPRDGTRRCDRRRFHRQIPAILKDESVGAIVLHAGVNDIRLRQTEVLKRDFGSLIETVRSTAPETRIIVSGPLPTVVLLHVCLDKPQEDCVSVDYSDCADSGLHCQLVESRLARKMAELSNGRTSDLQRVRSWRQKEISSASRVSERHERNDCGI